MLKIVTSVIIFVALLFELYLYANDNNSISVKLKAPNISIFNFTLMETQIEKLFKTSSSAPSPTLPRIQQLSSSDLCRSKPNTQEWANLDLYKLPEKTKSDFFAYKEAIYRERRERIWKMCQKMEDNPSRTRTLKEMKTLSSYFMQYISQHRVAYCHIPKVWPGK